MRWLVADSLYCREQFPFSHLDSYSYYLAEAGEFVRYTCLNMPIGSSWSEIAWSYWDRLFMLDRYERALEIEAEKRIAQVAAVCSPMPWEVRKPDGSPAFDLVISSLRWQVAAAEAAGCRAAWMPLAFDHRSLVCGMGIERDISCLFLGSTGGNHRRRTLLLEELKDVVTIAPPTFGREMFRLLARAKSVFHCSAEWAHGEANAMRLAEASGMGALVLQESPESSDGPWFDVGAWYRTAGEVREIVSSLSHWETARQEDRKETIANQTYIQRIPELISLARSL